MNLVMAANAIQDALQARNALPPILLAAATDALQAVKKLRSLNGVFGRNLAFHSTNIDLINCNYLSL